MKLKKHWQVIFTLIVLTIGMIIYFNTKNIGLLATKNYQYLTYNIMSWVYIFIIQPFTILLIWL